MTTAATTHTYDTLDDTPFVARRSRARRMHSILSRHVPSCRVRGLGL